MFGGRGMFVCLTLSLVGLSGCAGAGSVRYVYQDGQSGVIGMPANTSSWPTYYRKHADKLMKKHFPEGYEIVRAEEVVEGSRTLTVQGSAAAEIQPSASSNLVALGKLGGTRSHSQSDLLKIKECRILYRKGGPIDPEGQAELDRRALWTPEPYVDPNALDRKLAKKKLESADAVVAKEDAASSTQSQSTSAKLATQPPPKAAEPSRDAAADLELATKSKSEPSSSGSTSSSKSTHASSSESQLIEAARRLAND